MKERAIPYRWVVAVTLLIAYSIQYLNRVGITILNPVIAQDVGLTTTDLGTGVFLMLLSYGPAQYLSGILTDRFGAKRILIFSVIAWSVMTAWMAGIQSREEYLWRMALFGALVGTAYVPSARTLMRWFNREGRARAQALLSWAWILTPAWASVFATQFAHVAGDWRIVFQVTAAFGIVPLAMIALLVFDRPEHYRGAKPSDLEYAYRDEIARGEVFEGNYLNVQRDILRTNDVRFRDLFKNPSYVAVVFIDIVMQITLYGALTWIPLYLFDVFHFKLQQMGWWSALYFAAGAVGTFLSSYLSDKVFGANRRVMILTCFIGLAPFVFLLATLNQANPTMLALCLCGMGFFGNMAWRPFLAVPAVTPEIYGKAMGFANGVGYMVAAFSAKIFAALVIIPDVAASDGGKDYSRGWIFIGACVVLGIIAASFIRTREKPVASSMEASHA